MTQSAQRAALGELHTEVNRFYVRDRALLQAQAAFAKVLESPGGVDATAARLYLRAIVRYFGGFEREARAHLNDIEARLARAAQLHFNLTAERGVATRRVEATQGVLARVRELGEQ